MVPGQLDSWTVWMDNLALALVMTPSTTIWHDEKTWALNSQVQVGWGTWLKSSVTNLWAQPSGKLMKIQKNIMRNPQRCLCVFCSAVIWIQNRKWMMNLNHIGGNSTSTLWAQCVVCYGILDCFTHCYRIITLHQASTWYIWLLWLLLYYISDRVIQRASIWWSIVMVLRLIYVRTMCAIVVWHFSLALRLWFSTLALWLWLKLSFEWLWTILPTTAISPMGFDRNIFWTLCIKRIANIGNIRFGYFHSNAHVCILGGCCGWCRNV